MTKTGIGKFNSFTEVLDFAINREEEANLFYTRLADIVTSPVLVKIIRGFAEEESGHKTKLEAVKAGQTAIKNEEVGNLNIADYVSDVEPNPDMSYVDLLVVAMKKENLSHKLYIDLADMAESPELKNIFMKLAQEEATHRLRFEFEYDLENF